MSTIQRYDLGAQVPLIERLRNVPRDGRLIVDTGPYDTTYYPVGYLCHEAADHLADKQAAVEAARAAEWQDIATAPKDGTVYLASDGWSIREENQPPKHYAGTWRWSDSRDEWRGHAHEDDFEAKHWMPRPPLPTTPEPRS